MDSFVLRWRALVWGRVWWSVAALTLGWSIGTGLALRAVTAYSKEGYGCYAVPPRPLLHSGWDVFSLPLTALIAAPFGFYVSGMTFLIGALAVAVAPAALLPQGTARRVLSAPVVLGAAALLTIVAWDVEIAAVRSGGIPSLVCSDSGFRGERP